MEQLYIDFLSLIPDESKTFVDESNSFLIDQKCKISIKPAAKGYLVTYSLPKSGKSLLNFVFRKGCVKARIYASHVAEYEELIEKFPEVTKKEISNSLDCKKLNGKTCNSICPAGYTFVIDGIEYKKCRSMAFMPTLNELNNLIIKEMIEKEIMFNTMNEKLSESKVW
ncbi:MAG TPA: hypothetical protein VIL26_07115 [Clostridia bacterium]